MRFQRCCLRHHHFFGIALCIFPAADSDSGIITKCIFFNDVIKIQAVIKNPQVLVI